MEKNKEYIFMSSSQVFETEAPIREEGFDEEKLHWSFVALRPKEVIEKVGWVDTIFERGSFVDTEWAIRTKKLGYKMARCLKSRFFHWNDSTHRFLPSYREVFGLNDHKLRQKWGNYSEYEFPYNDKELPLNFIGKYYGPSIK
jgi:GT2 family glycosyltransferase